MQDIEMLLRLVENGGKAICNRVLTDAVFSDLELSGIDFSGSTLNGVRFYRCNLSGARFNGTSMFDTEFMDCDMDGSDFTDAHIHARFTRCVLKNACFNKASFQHGYMRDSELSGAVMELVSMNGTWMDSMLFSRPLMPGYAISYTCGGATNEETKLQQDRLFRSLGISMSPDFDAVVRFEDGHHMHVSVAQGGCIEVRTMDALHDKEFSPVTEYTLEEYVPDIPSAVCHVISVHPECGAWGRFSVTTLSADELLAVMEQEA